jgi:hypothetical protein
LFTVGVEGFCNFHLITLKHTPQSVGSLWTRDRPVAETSTWQHKHCTRQTSMPSVRFELTIPASARPQTYALDRAPLGPTPQIRRAIRKFLEFTANYNSLCNTTIREEQKYTQNVRRNASFLLHEQDFVESL